MTVLFGGVHAVAGEALSPDGTQEKSQSQGSKLPNATMVPQSNVVADIVRHEDELSLMQENAAGTATPVGIAVYYWRTRKAQG